MKTYYYCYRHSYGAPIVRHATLAEAITEANRLAEQNPGAKIEILKCVGVSAVRGPASVEFVENNGAETL